MNVLEIEKIHEKYDNYMEGYNLLGSYSVFVPFFKIKMKMKYIYETQLNVIEEYICKCIDRGITDEQKIMFVLALEEDIFDFAMTSLIENNYLKVESTKYPQVHYKFTELGKELSTNKQKHEPRVRTTEWFFDGLNPQYKIDFFGDEESHAFKRYKDIIKETKSIILLPKTFPDYDRTRDFHMLSKKVLSSINVINKLYDDEIEKEKIVSIEDFEVSKDREILYHEYRILAYKNKNEEYKLLAHDPCGMEFIDQRVTDTMLSLYNNGKFNEFLNGVTTDNQGIHNILLALENYAKAQIDTMEEEELEECIENIKIMKKEKISQEYIMNYRIREMFLKYLKEAEKSLYIISPWMNHYIVNDDFKKSITKLLDKGVKIRIICGITDENDKNMNFRDEKTFKIAKILIKLTKPYGDLFKIEFGQTHEKLLICDDKYYICGSFNFLSSDSEDENLIKQTIKLRFNF